MKAYGKYDVVKMENGKTTLYKVCPSRAYAATVAHAENANQFKKGIAISDPRFVNYFIRLHKDA